MARFGISPTRGKVTKDQPACVTVAVLTFIPELEGYYRYRMEVLRACLESILKHTDMSYDLMVFDNGSCEEVVDYLRSMHQARKIDYLMLSGKNLGIIGALQVMFNAAPGELIAYCDDDILFYPGWLSEHVKIIDTFPNVGMVSGVPVRNAAGHACWSNQAFIDGLPEGVQVEHEHWIPDEWERDWAVSTDRDPDAHLEATKDQQDTRLTTGSVSAYAAANHFQYLAPRQVLLNAMPQEWTGSLMGYMIELDEAIDGQGLLRLSTTERYTRHIGNVVSPELAEELKQMGIGVSGVEVSRRAKRHWLLTIPRMRPLLEKIYGQIYKILHHVDS
jgi:glycosyltransferase involved in cell wall biosynthesis